MSKNFSCIRHLAMSNANTLLAAEFETHIHVWDINRNCKRMSFDGHLDFGGTRLAVSSNGSLCFAGCYNRWGVGAYEVNSGKELWRQKEVKQFQHVAYDPHNACIHCGTTGRCWSFDALSGKKLESLRGVKKVWVSSHQNDYVLGARKIDFHSPFGNRRFSLENTSFGILSVAFSPNNFAISEAVSSVRIVDRLSGKNTFTYTPPKGSHVLELGWSTERNMFFGLEWPFSQGGDYTLLCFNQKQNTTVKICSFPFAATTTFHPQKGLLITSEGDIRKIEKGSLVNQLKFPRP